MRQTGKVNAVNAVDSNAASNTDVEQPPHISLVIPAYNEAAHLPALLDSVEVARQHYRRGAHTVEVIVGNNASTDDTANIALARGCRVAHVTERRIACARNGGAALARGTIIAFIDGDSRIHPNTFNVIEEHLTERVVVGATSIDPERWSWGIRATWLLATIMTWFMRIDAGVVFCRRADFETIGGYDESLDYAEDVQFLIDLKRLGKPRGQKFFRADMAKAITSVRKFDKFGHWHYFTHMPRVAFWMVINRSRAHDFTQRYWYKDR